MTNPMPDGYVIHLPAPANPPPQPHVFGAHVRVPPNPLLARHAQTERTCLNCGAVKVTVHAPDGGCWREWRTSADAEQVATGVWPPCVGFSRGQT